MDEFNVGEIHYGSYVMDDITLILQRRRNCREAARSAHSYSEHPDAVKHAYMQLIVLFYINLKILIRQACLALHPNRIARTYLMLK